MFSTTTIKLATTDGHNFVVDEEFSYTEISGKVHVIPVGSKTDGISSPRALWVSVPPFGAAFMASVVHDHLYRDTLESKDECDRIFLEAMLSSGVSPDEAKLLYAGVHDLGWSSFEEDRAALQAKVKAEAAVT